MCVQGREWGSNVPSGSVGSPDLQFRRQWDRTGPLGGASRTSCLPKPQKREACLQKRGYLCTACWEFSGASQQPGAAPLVQRVSSQGSCVAQVPTGWSLES